MGFESPHQACREPFGLWSGFGYAGWVLGSPALGRRSARWPAPTRTCTTARSTTTSSSDQTSRDTETKTLVADGSGDGWLTAGPAVRRSRGGNQDDRRLCWWVHCHSGQEANRTAPLGRQCWAEQGQPDDRGRLRPDDAAAPGRPASGTLAGAAPSTPARSGDLLGYAGPQGRGRPAVSSRNGVRCQSLRPSSGSLDGATNLLL